LPRSLSIAVVGSINLDLVARSERLPRPGETLTDATFERIPGGKGANQALAAARLGVGVRLVGAVGDDPFADEALVLLREGGVDLDGVRRVSDTTGVALILVGGDGENEIVVAPGANLELTPDDLDIEETDAVLCQLEIPLETVERAAELAPDRFFLNAAPARGPFPAADVTIVNRFEEEALPQRDGVVVVTLGPEGAVLFEDGEEIVRVAAPRVEAVDGTGAGDAFTACFVVSTLEGRSSEEALRRACAAGAIAASRFGAQTSLPTADEVDALL